MLGCAGVIDVCCYVACVVMCDAMCWMLVDDSVMAR